jgi:hypothetical protein
MENALGLFDSNRGAQDFFRQLLELVCGYGELKDLDKLNDKTNYYAIDLGDKTAKVAFQITTDSSSTKIKDTIEKFNTYKLYDEYDRLIIFIIGKKRGYTTTFPTGSKLVFNSDKDIWDDEDFIKLIDVIDDVSRIQAIYKCLDDNLLEYKFPDHLTFEDIKACIAYMLEGVADMLSEVLEATRREPIRGSDDFITRKNELNGVTFEFFKSNIQGHLSYGPLIQQFLSDPINVDSLDAYNSVTQTIQKFYTDNKADFESFEDVFSAIFSKLKPDYSNPRVDKVIILLHNMYFNCDIGDNPDA